MTLSTEYGGKMVIDQNDEPAQRRAWLQGLRARADEARTIAEQMQYPVARNTMSRLAVTFEKLADRLEGQQPEDQAIRDVR
jgi:hypothetical protein